MTSIQPPPPTTPQSPPSPPANPKWRALLQRALRWAASALALLWTLLRRPLARFYTFLRQDRPKDPWPTMPEPARGRYLAIAAVVTLCTMFAYTLWSYWGGAHGGVDQAGYLMTARLIAGETNVDHNTQPLSPPLVTEPEGEPAPAPSVEWMGPAKGLGLFIRDRLGFVPENSFQFGSRMCVMTEPYHDPVDATQEPYRVYAKYPFGFPLLAAIARWLYGSWDGMYIVNPLCTVLACFFSYFLFRTAVTRFTAVMGALFVAANPVVLHFANDANSHASTLFCVVFGFWGLLSWWQTGSLWRGFFGAFALGYACTIRYSEALLALPVMFAALTNFRLNWKSARGSLAVILGWAIPVGTLAFVCLVCYGLPWKTGYTYCKEDTGFGWQYFIGDNSEPTNRSGLGNWETLIQQLNRVGLFMLWPLAIAGVMGMLGKAWRLGTVLALWVLPGLFLYMFYYWAPQGETSMGYLRFFATVVPGLIFAAIWVIDRGMHAVPGSKWPSMIFITLVGTAAAAWATYYWWPADYAGNGMGDWLAAYAPALAAGTLFLAITALIWVYDRPVAAQRGGLALAMLTLGGLYCGLNVVNWAPLLEADSMRHNNLHASVDYIRKGLKPGAVLFANEYMCQQLDSTGGYQLFSHELWQSGAFSNFQRRYNSRAGEGRDLEDPDPVQHERSAYYMKLLGRKTARGTWVAKSNNDMDAHRWDIINKALDRGQAVGWLSMEDDRGNYRDPRNPAPPEIKGYLVSPVAVWRETPAVDAASLQPRWSTWRGPPRRGPQPPRREDPARTPGPTWVLYEITRVAPATQPSTTQSAATETRNANGVRAAVRTPEPPPPPPKVALPDGKDVKLPSEKPNAAAAPLRTGDAGGVGIRPLGKPEALDIPRPPADDKPKRIIPAKPATPDKDAPRPLPM